MSKTTLFALFWLVVLAGCLTADATLKADGSGVIEITYDPILPTTKERARAGFTAPGVTVQEIEVKELRPGSGEGSVQQRVRTRLAFEDVGKLGQVEKLRRFAIDLTDAEHDTKRLTIAVRKGPGDPAKKSAGRFTHKEAVTIRIQCPGEVLASSAKVEGNTVLWTFPAADLFPTAEIKMTATYKLPAEKAAPAEEAVPGEKPPPAPSSNESHSAAARPS